MSDRTAEHLANNIKQLREARGLTQKQLSDRAGVPRATWAHMESGGGNPTLQILVRIANALQVSFDELIGPPRALAKHFPAASLPVKKRGQVSVRQLLPDAIAGFVMDRMDLPAGAHMAGIPHTPGTREYLTCEAGQIELSESGTTWLLNPGDVVVFRGDQKHGYRNPGRARAIAYSVVMLAPVAAD